MSTFTKLSNGRIIYEDSEKHSFLAANNILPHPSDSALILISPYASGQQATDEGFSLSWSDVTIPSGAANRSDLIQLLSDIYFSDGGVVSDDNSSETPLGADEVFLGTGIIIIVPGIVFVNVFSDVASAADGLNIQQSSNGINWDHDDKYTVPANKGKNYSINPHSKFLKVDYANGSSPQNEFRLQTIVKVYSLESSHRIQDTISTEDDARLIKAILAADSGDGLTFKNIGLQNPLSVDGDSLYEKDIDQARSTSDGFTGGTVIDLFNDRHTVLINSTGTNPKIIKIVLKRPIQTNILGFTTATGTFSNTKITAIVGLGGDAINMVLIDESADNTDKTLLLPNITPSTFTELQIEFHTADACSISTIGVSKSLQRISRLQAISELTNLVENIASFRGALKVDTALVHSKGIDINFHRETGIATTLNTAVSVGDTTLDVVSAVGFNIGDDIHLPTGEETGEFFFRITNIAANVLTLDMPIIRDVDAGSPVEVISYALNVDGTLASPVIFSVAPPAGAVWQLTRTLIAITDATAMDDGKFGALTALTNGVVIRSKKNGVFGNQINWKTNGDMALTMYDVIYTDKAPAGENGLRGRWTFTKGEFTIELNGDTGDELQLLVQDALSGLSSYGQRLQGRLFGG